jgi:hypothetical protein
MECSLNVVRSRLDRQESFGSWCRIETLNHAGYKWTLVKEGEQPRSSWDSAPPQPPPQPDNDPWARESSGTSTVQVLCLLWRPVCANAIARLRQQRRLKEGWH